MKKMNLTPNNLVEVFMLCLYWQWRPTKLHYTYTTIDKVLRILKGLGVVTAEEVKRVRTSGIYAETLREKIRVTYHAWLPDSELDVGRDPGTPTYRALAMLQEKKWLCVTKRKSTPLKMMALVRDQRIHLTYKGAEYAKSTEERYSIFFTKDEYLAEEIRQEELFRSEAGRVAAINQYRDKVAEEVEGIPKKNKKGPQITLTRLW